MLHDNVYLMRQIVAFCAGSNEEIEQIRSTLYKVCRKWRKSFKLHFWTHPTSAYIKALENRNTALANAIWDFSGECIERTNHLLMIMCKNGCNANHLEQLLQDPGVNPASDGNCAIRRASTNGHAAVVDRLLQDPRVDPTALDNCVIRWASKNGHVVVVDRLMQDPRVDPAALDNCAIRCASEMGRLAIVDRLLQDPRVDPAALDNCAIRYASGKD